MNYSENSDDKKDAILIEIKKRERFEMIEKERKNICERGTERRKVRNRFNSKFEEELFNSIGQSKNKNGVEMRIEQEEKLAKELDRVKREEIKDLKLRQQLRANCTELRDLESKLRAAYVSKELCAQIAENEYKKHQQKMQDKEANEILRLALLSNLEAEHNEKQDEINRKYEYKKELQDQMILQYQEKQNSYEEFLKEKKLLDQIIQRIHDEDQREMEEKMYRMKKTKEEIDTFKAAQSIWRNRERIELEEENRRIQTFLKENEQRARDEKNAKMEESEAKMKITEELSKKIYLNARKREEREEIIQNLLEEELLEKEEKRVKDDFKRQVDQRMEMNRVLAHQLEEQEARLRREEADEALYKQQMLEKALDNKKLDQLSEEKRRRKMIELRRELEDHMKERRARRAEQLRHLLKLQEQEKQAEEDRQQVIANERLRILKEHANNLIGYIPPGVLRADDLPLLGSEFAARYS